MRNCAQSLILHKKAKCRSCQITALFSTHVTFLSIDLAERTVLGKHSRATVVDKKRCQYNARVSEVEFDG